MNYFVKDIPLSIKVRVSNQSVCNNFQKFELMYHSSFMRKINALCTFHKHLKDVNVER